MRKPDAQFDRVIDISPQFFIDNNIKGVILDVDNTLIGLDRKNLPNVFEWIRSLQQANLKICIASNSRNKKKISKFASEVNIPYVLFSCKPLKRGLKKALKELNMPPENVAEIGDQLFTDVWGAKRMNMFAILTKPFTPERNFVGRFKRSIEQNCLEKFETSEEKTVERHDKQKFERAIKKNVEARKEKIGNAVMTRASRATFSMRDNEDQNER